MKIEPPEYLETYLEFIMFPIIPKDKVTNPKVLITSCAC